MFLNLISRLCCGVPSENVVAGPALEVRGGGKQNRASNDNDQGLQSAGYPCLSTPEDVAVHKLVTTSQTAWTTEAERILQQELSSFIGQNATASSSAFHDDLPKTNLTPTVSTMESRGQAPSPMTEVLADKDPNLRTKEPARPQYPAVPSSNKPHSPFTVTSVPATPLDGPQLQGGSLFTQAPPAGLTNLLCGAASGMDLRTRHVASIASTEMQLTTSLSEPLIHSISPGNGNQEQLNCSSSIGTAVTATSGGSSAAAALQQHPVWTGTATGLATSAYTASSATAISVAAVPVAERRGCQISVERFGNRENRSRRGSGTVERSGGSRLGRPELAVLGAVASAATATATATAAATAAATASATSRAAAGADVRGPEPPAGGAEGAAAASKAGVSNVVMSGDAGAIVNLDTGGGTTKGSQTSVGTVGGSGGGGVRGGSALGLLGDVTRRLLHRVHDVSIGVSHAAAAVASRADGAYGGVAAAPDASASGQGGGGGGSESASAAEVREDGAAAPVQWTTAALAATPPNPLPQVPPLPCSAHGQEHEGQQLQQEKGQERSAANSQWIRPRTEYGQTEAAATVTAAAVPAVLAAASPPAATALHMPYVAGRGSLRGGSDSGSAVLQRGQDGFRVVQLSGAYPPYAGTGPWTSRLTKYADRDVSQVALMQMLHFGCTSGRVPLQHLATLNLAALSREIRALHWVGQGGGGAVFQGVWQGAPVAVKFMLATRPEHVDATALEAIVSLAVGHPNVVTTYSFDVTRVSEASLLPDAAAAVRYSRLSQQPATLGEDSSATALFDALMETDTISEPPGLAGCGGAHRHRQHGTPGCSGSGSSGSRPTSVHRTESLSVRLRRAQAAAAVAGNTPDGGAEGTPIVTATAADGSSDGSLGSNHDAGRAGAAGGDWRSDAARAPSIRPSQRQHAAPPPLETLGIESAFSSEEGFGDPDLTDNSPSWTVRHVLAYLKARPGMYMTHIIMEYCDRGSLLSAIKSGIFRMDGLPDSDVVAASSGAAAASGAGGAAATSTAAAAVGLPALPRFTRRVVLRALLRTARDIAKGMCHLHANGIIHGDLKPGNVLLRGCRSDRRGFVAVVSDFGLSKITRGEKPLELNHWSTVTVMAPEVIMGRWLKASDVFSFGILLWQLVTGEMMPYGNATVHQVLMGVAHGALKPEWPASAHPPLVRLGRACLATSPEKRPSFGAIVKILIKMEQHVRNAHRPTRDLDSSTEGGSQHSRSSRGSENAGKFLNRLRSSAM
ncbi:hypothetical protein VaNZ11_016534 [Volvox africanus]|uniref:Protein kinase domain-containing protein n=1 Tax=Volvox africanus TaxID=51714 RepID=A0ABQ5SPV6_9CHLO|nr:hypothetical protein VaNZ11_016534 [Volvox africanus]